MLSLKQGIKLSAIVDKLDLEVKTTKKNEKGETERLTQQEVGADLIMQAVRKAHKAEQEIYNFVAEVKKITPNEAEEVDIVEFIKEMFSDAGTVDFLKSAVTSKDQESLNSFQAPMI